MSDLRLRRAAKKGFQFNIIVVGASGLGKATFVNTLCGEKVIQRVVSDNPADLADEKPISINPYTVEIDDDGIKLQMTVIDTPGFGDSINNSNNFNQILGYLEKQYDDVLAEESKIKRNPKFQDNRVHCLLYFIPPTGHSLREIDITLMKKVATRTNIIPVIAKADTLTPPELAAFKQRVMEDIRAYGIQIYDFPFSEDVDDEETVSENRELRAMLPFAVIGCDEEIDVGGKKVRGRKYPWGIVEVENLNHCEFTRLRYVLLSSHLQELKEITHDVLYEQYRSEKLSKLEGLAEQLANLSHESGPLTS